MRCAVISMLFLLTGCLGTHLPEDFEAPHGLETDLFEAFFLIRGQIGSGTAELPKGLLEMAGVDAGQLSSLGRRRKGLHARPYPLVQEEPGPELRDFREDRMEGLPQRRDLIECLAEAGLVARHADPVPRTAGQARSQPRAVSRNTEAETARTEQPIWSPSP